MKFTIGIQARSKSTRLPGKCLMKINGVEMWRIVYNEVKDICDTFMLIPHIHEDLEMKIATQDVPVMLGSMDSPLDRYLQLYEHENPDMIIRITADCPLINKIIIMDMIRIVEEEKYEYLQCELDGMDVQIFSGKILIDPVFQSKEHVINVAEVKNQIPSIYHAYEMHLSVDTKDQFSRISKMMDRRKNSKIY
jgi:spore coat polysaccharide biosynthesis protein SpsF (cytidylyltransferase family)